MNARNLSHGLALSAALVACGSTEMPKPQAPDVIIPNVGAPSYLSLHGSIKPLAVEEPIENMRKKVAQLGQRLLEYKARAAEEPRNAALFLARCETENGELELDSINKIYHAQGGANYEATEAVCKEFNAKHPERPFQFEMCSFSENREAIAALLKYKQEMLYCVEREESRSDAIRKCVKNGGDNCY